MVIYRRIENYVICTNGQFDSSITNKTFIIEGTQLYLTKPFLRNKRFRRLILLVVVHFSEESTLRSNEMI